MSGTAIHWRCRLPLPWRWRVIRDGIVADQAMTQRAALRRRGVPAVWSTVARNGSEVQP